MEVDKSTLQALKELKAELGARSVDETIQVLIRRVRQIPRSKFGAHPDMTPFKPEDEAAGHEP